MGGLQAHAHSVELWCRDVGAAYLDEIAENVTELCDDVEFTYTERERLMAWAVNFNQEEADRHMMAEQLSAPSVTRTAETPAVASATGDISSPNPQQRQQQQLQQLQQVSQPGELPKKARESQIEEIIESHLCDKIESTDTKRERLMSEAAHVNHEETDSCRRVHMGAKRCMMAEQLSIQPATTTGTPAVASATGYISALGGRWTRLPKVERGEAALVSSKALPTKSPLVRTVTTTLLKVRLKSPLGWCGESEMAMPDDLKDDNAEVLNERRDDDA